MSTSQFLQGEKYFNVVLLLVICLNVLNIAVAGDRKVRVYPQYQCTSNNTECWDGDQGSFANLAYVRSDGTNDTLHYVFSSIGSLSVLIVRTEPSVTMNVDWDKLLLPASSILGFESEIEKGAITFTGTAKSIYYSFAVVFTRLIEYNDTLDTANLNSYSPTSTNWSMTQLSDFKWQDIRNFSAPEDGKIVFNSSDPAANSTGFVAITFNVYNTTSRAPLLPHLEYNSDLTEMELLIDHMVPRYASSRFAVELVVLSQDKPKQASTSLVEDNSIDDEYSPGVFRLEHWYTRQTERAHGGFVQWKPVCYTKPIRARDDGTRVETYSLVDVPESDTFKPLINSIAYGYYGDQIRTKTLAMKASNISFGLPEDKTYVHTNYTVWMVNIGYGTPPVDKVSAVVIIIIAVGLGIPFLLMIFAGIYLFLKKRRDRKVNANGLLTASFPAVN